MAELLGCCSESQVPGWNVPGGQAGTAGRGCLISAILYITRKKRYVGFAFPKISFCHGAVVQSHGKYSLERSLFVRFL